MWSLKEKIETKLWAEIKTFSFVYRRISYIKRFKTQWAWLDDFLIYFTGLSKHCSYLAVLFFLAFILTMSAAAVWGVPDKTGEVDDDQHDDID